MVQRIDEIVLRDVFWVNSNEKLIYHRPLFVGLNFVVSFLEYCTQERLAYDFKNQSFMYDS